MSVAYRKIGSGMLRPAELYYKVGSGGRTINHPWFTTVDKTGVESFGGSNSKAKDVEAGFGVRIKPGFVNGIAAIAEQTSREKRLVDGVIKEVTVLKDVNLLNKPIISIPLDQKYFSRTPIPLPFFAEMGASNPSSGDGVQVSDSGVQIEAKNESGGRKDKSYLLQSVIYLSIARATQRLETSVTGDILAGSIVEYYVTYDTRALQASGQLPRIQIAGTMPEPAPITALLRTYEDSGFDNIEIATVYYVSPKGFAEDLDATPGKNETPSQAAARGQKRGLIPGKDWDIYVKHNLFWNLFYQMKTEPPINLPGGRLDLATAAFTGRYTVAAGAVTGAINAQLNEVLAAAFNSTSNRGRFWSA